MKKLSLLSLILLCLTGCGIGQSPSRNMEARNPDTNQLPAEELLKTHSVAYFASGCFWCVEEVFESMVGVVECISGYAGGDAADANYQQVSSGRTHHAEAVQIFYDQALVTYEQLLIAFFGSHDPTTLNRQGPDAGPQYRSVIFYQNKKEHQAAQDYISALTNKRTFSRPIVTELGPFTAFYPAEDYHQDYVRHHPDNGYVRGVSLPRFQAFVKKHPELLKRNEHNAGK